MLQLRVLGGASIASPAGPVTGRAAQRHRLALLAFLAAAPSGVARDRLVSLLWPDASLSKGRKLLSDSVYRINAALGSDPIQAVGDELRLDAAVVSCDLHRFRHALGQEEWKEAIESYGGAFLDGFFLPGAVEFDQWMESERERLSREYQRALEGRADADEKRGDLLGAVTAWESAATADPYNARVACRFMEALDRAGERARAVGHAQVYRALLEQLDLEPDLRVLELAREIGERPTGSELPFRSRPAGSEVPLPERREARLPRSEGAEGERAPDSNPNPAPRTPLARSMPASSAGEPSTVSPSNRSRRRRQRVGWAAMGGLCLMVVAGIVLFLGGSGATLDSSVAVLPFHDLSPGGDHEYFADGLTEELMARLARIEGLRVAARTSSFAFKGRSDDVREVGRHLGVSSVVEGSVRMVGDRLRITVQLVSTADGYQLWSESYDRTLDDVFVVQADIARAVAFTLGGRLLGPEVRVAEEPVPVDTEAYDLYLRGRFAWHRRTEEGLRAAVKHFQEAVRLSPGYTPAWVGLGDAWGVLGFYDYVSPAEAFPQAEVAAQRALALDPKNASAHATLGYVALYHRWDAPRAEGEFQHAIALDPRYSTGHQWYANFLTASGRFPEAEGSMRRAQELDPLSLIANAALGWVRFFAGRYEEALEQCRQTLELDPDFELAYLWSGWALEALGRHEEALDELRKAERLSGGSGIVRASLARLHAVRGETGEARRIVEALEGSEEYIPSYELGKVHLALGEPDLAMEWLERAFQERSHSMVFLAVDPQLEDLREDPRFQTLVERVGFGE
jgi:TolB-like protein/DNA-binding SARP family transcriptional activator/Tfp pilus assembly protein PilF